MSKKLLPFERVKPKPFAIVAPFAEQACDLVKHNSHFTRLSLSPRLKIRKTRTELTTPYSHRQKITLEQTAASSYNTPIVQGPCNSSPHPFLILLQSNKSLKSPPLTAGASPHTLPLSFLREGIKNFILYTFFSFVNSFTNRPNTFYL